MSEVKSHNVSTSPDDKAFWQQTFFHFISEGHSVEASVKRANAALNAYRSISKVYYVIDENNRSIGPLSKNEVASHLGSISNNQVDGSHASEEIEVAEKTD